MDIIGLEEFASNLRKILQIDQNVILNPKNFDELLSKIQQYDDFKIVQDQGGPTLVLDKGKEFTIFIEGNVDTKFYDLVRLFTFATLLDKSALNQYELNHSEFNFPRFSANQKSEDYLMLAFMMPRDAFVKELVKYEHADGARVRMFDMQSEVNRYCYKRGIDLGLWNM